MNDLPLVMLHGYLGGGEQWHPQYAGLAPKRKIITPDLPGFGGKSDRTAPDRMEGFARHILDELHDQSVHRFALLGHSMGGMIVQEMIALAPEKIDSLILYGTAATGDLPGRFESFATSRKRLHEDGERITARRITANFFLDYDADKEYEACAAIAERASMQAMLAGLEAMERWSREDNLASITCPTQIIWGEYDRTYKWQQIEQLWRQIPKASLAVLPRCAHIAHLEKPLLFNQILADFLNSIST